MTRQVFVYGSLRRGEGNHRILTTARFVTLARTARAYTLVDLGAYPGLLEGGTYAVVGEIYEVDAHTLAALDRMEGHPTFYERKALVLEDGIEVEGYVLARDQWRVRAAIESGDWCEHRKGKTRCVSSL